jgi:hypothetical protein
MPEILRLAAFADDPRGGSPAIAVAFRGHATIATAVGIGA